MPGVAPEELARCRRCPRLVDYIGRLPPKKGRCRTDYWNAPVPGFGDPGARVCLVGLAPGAHGANRTGRPFTGDGAGDFMYPLLHRAGFSNRAESLGREDGFGLRDLYITNAVKCVPPANRPLPAEFATCRPYLAAELADLPRLRVVIALGREAWLSLLRHYREQGLVRRLGDHPFAHGARACLPGMPVLLASYHTSRYNVQTGRIRPGMFLELLATARSLAGGENG